MADVVPPGYETFREALRRAREMWSLDSGGKLLGLLVKGALQAWRVDAAGDVEGIPKNYWKDDKSVRLFKLSANELYEMKGLPIFLTSDLRREMPDRWERQEQRNAERRESRKRAVTVAVRNKGGAPTQFDWDAMWIETVRIFYQEKPPDKRHILRKRLHDWFSETGRSVPGETIMKKKVKALFDVIKAKD